ncbi:MAG: hypothetical protein KDD70_18165 [Bdellovibrionales bacterium]|nr:hypothetical protein [Bdellovibrionales bacterium]
MGRNTKALVNWTATLLVGVALGYVIAYYRMADDRGGFGGYSKEGGRVAHLLRVYTDRLELTAAQQSKVEDILSEQQEKLSKMFQAMSPGFQSVREEAHGKIEALLEKEQQDKFLELKTEMEEYRQKRWGKR